MTPPPHSERSRGGEGCRDSPGLGAVGGEGSWGPQDRGGLGVAGPPRAGRVCELGVVEGFSALFCVSVCVWGPLQRGLHLLGWCGERGAAHLPSGLVWRFSPFQGVPIPPSSKAAVIPRVNF